jgi:DNA-binding transcriptional ArsR family regulator
MGGRKKGQRRSGPTFVQLYNYVLDSPAYEHLSVVARAVLIEISRLYKGNNNGMLVAPVQMIADRIRMSKATASRALVELEEFGFIEAVKVGTFARKDRMASEYRLTFHRCDLTLRPPTRAFLKWRPTKESPAPRDGRYLDSVSLVKP